MKPKIKTSGSVTPAARAAIKELKDYYGYYPVIAPLIMCSGVGDGKTTACVMAQAATINALRKGLTLDKPTDEMECACPVLRRMAIKANDTNWWASDEERTEHLRPLIPLLLDSRVNNEVTWKRIFKTVDSVVRVLTPMRLEHIAENSNSEKIKKANADGAKQLRGLAEITTKKDCKAARGIIRPLKAEAEAYAYASAYADAEAHASAYAYASAYADAEAYAYASASAYASAYAHDRTAYLQLFREVAAIVK